MRLRPRTLAGIFLAALGLVPIVVEYAFYIGARRAHLHYDFSPWIMFGGPIISFVGGALLDFNRAKDIAGVVVTSGTTILGALPFAGRRWTDKVAAKQIEEGAATVGEPPHPAVITQQSATGDVLHTVPGVSTDRATEEHDG